MDNYSNFLNSHYADKQQIEKLHLIIAHKDELLVQKDNEIALLKELLQTYKDKPN
ncbi:MAG: hypothetical protein Q4A69_03405 [Moraxella sp.]|nr:hypothetical protein [Moraxella sp.]